MTKSHKPATIRQRVIRNVRNLTIAYLFVVLMLSLFQRKLIYVPGREQNLSAKQYGPSFSQVEDIATTTDDGVTINGWRWKSTPNLNQPDQPRLAILLLHGNGGHRFHRFDECDMLVRMNADVIIFDYRGYGDNEGKPTEEGLALDAAAAWKFTTEELGFKPEQIVLFGESLGGGVAVRLAHDLQEKSVTPGGLILRSTFSSLADAASHKFPWLPVRTILVDRYPSVDRIGELKCPILSFHGDQDKVVPFRLGKTLFEAAPESSANGIEKRFVTLPKAGHNDVMSVSGPLIQQEVDDFLSRVRDSTESQQKAH